MNPSPLVTDVYNLWLHFPSGPLTTYLMPNENPPDLNLDEVASSGMMTIPKGRLRPLEVHSPGWLASLYSWRTARHYSCVQGHLLRPIWLWRLHIALQITKSVPLGEWPYCKQTAENVNEGSAFVFTHIFEWWPITFRPNYDLTAFYQMFCIEVKAT